MDLIGLGILGLLIIIAWNIKAGFQNVEKQLQMMNENLKNKNG